MATDTRSAEHYTWGGNCDGWRLLDSDTLSVIEERMPPGAQEVPHFHEGVQQFFYVLHGQLTIELGPETEKLHAGQGLHIPPRVPHVVRNTSQDDVEFLVISQPKVRGDRVPVGT